MIGMGSSGTVSVAVVLCMVPVVFCDFDWK